MNFINLEILGIYLIEGKIFKDERGIFLKIFNFDIFKEKGLETNFKESYFSISKKNVIRGMHFQTPPKDHAKIVYVSNGKIIDILLDIRKNSLTYGKYLKIELDSKKGYFLYIPKGIAHGFLALENNTIVNYIQTTGYSQENDSGIKYSSFGYNWENIKNPIVSDRDLSFVDFKNFNSPFIF